MFLLSHKYQARLKKLAMDKQSTLFGLFITDKSAGEHLPGTNSQACTAS
jgi:hypothetical protein